MNKFQTECLYLMLIRGLMFGMQVFVGELHTVVEL